MQTLRAIIYKCLCCAGLLCSLSLAAQAPDREYQIKAAFLFNFTHFVDWPPTAFSSSHAPMTLCVLGKDILVSYIDQVISGEKLNEHSLTVKRYSAVDDIESCHILFIEAGDKNKTEQVIEKVKGRSVLTVGESPDFLIAGGMIRLYMKDNKIRLQVNPAAMKAAGLMISSGLLRQVEIYSEKRTRP